MNRKGAWSRGSIAIVALWALTFFAMLTVTLAARIQSQISFIKRFQDSSRLEQTASSGISYAIQVLRKKAPVEEAQAQGDARFRGFEKNSFMGPGGTGFQIGHYEMNGQTRELEFVFGFQDEESKINVNKAAEEVLARVYQNAGQLSEDQAKGLAHASVEWRARQKEFLEFGHKLGKDGAGFGSLEELLLVPGMTSALLERLADHLTVFGEGRVNMNTVSVGTLKALGVSESLALRIDQVRQAQLGALKPDDASDLKAFNDLGDLTQKVGVSAGEIDQLQNIASIWGFESKTVRFVSRASNGRITRRGMECVASRDEGRLLFLRVTRDHVTQ